MSNATIAPSTHHYDNHASTLFQSLWPWLTLGSVLAIGAVSYAPDRLIDQRWQPLLSLALVAIWSTQRLYPYITRLITEHGDKHNRSTAAKSSITNAAMVPYCLYDLLLVLTVISTLFAVNQPAAWTAAGYLLFGILLNETVRRQPWLQVHPKRLAWGLVALGIGLLIIAPSMVQWKTEFRLFYLPIYDWFQQISIDLGETIHANILAGALVQITTICVALALPPLQTRLPTVEGESGNIRYVRIKSHKSDRIQQWAALLIATLLMTLLILTQSRGAYLGMAAALLVLAMLRWPRLLWTLPLLGVVIGFGVSQIGISAAFDLLGADNTFGGADWRTGIWHAAGQAIHDFPYTGIGIGNFRSVLPLLYPHPVLEGESANHAHNLVLQIALDLGLPGLFAYYFFVVGTLWSAGQRLRRRLFVAAPEVAQTNESSRHRHKRLVRLARLHNENWALTAGALAALVGVQVHGLLDAVTWGTKLAFLPWLCLALIVLTTQAQQPTTTVDPS